MYGPYDWHESLYWLKKYIGGPVMGSATPVPFPASRTILCDVEPAFDIVFAGDLMSLGQASWNPGPKLERWITDADYFVVNLEAPITDRKARFHLKQFNEARALAPLLESLDADRVFLSLANNHANDFGPEELSRSARLLREKGLQVFGLADSPSALIADRVLVHGATQWTNGSAEGLSWLDGHATVPDTPADLKLLFCHWGYEFELYPRAEQMAYARRLCASWDGIIGHHSHCPQPISFLQEPNASGRGFAKPVAYSLGNFAIAYQKQILNHGLTVRLTIGTPRSPAAADPSAARKLAIGALEWSFLEIKKQSPTSVTVELRESCPLF